MKLRIGPSEWQWMSDWSEKTGFTRVALISAVLKAGVDALKADPEKLVFPIKLKMATKDQ